MIELTRTKKNLKLQSNTMKGIDRMNEELSREERLKIRKCVVEHPFGTIKRWCDASYVLLKGKVKAGADLSLSFLAYNMKRAINIVGVERLIEQMI